MPSAPQHPIPKAAPEIPEPTIGTHPRPVVLPVVPKSEQRSSKRPLMLLSLAADNTQPRDDRRRASRRECRTNRFAPIWTGRASLRTGKSGCEGRPDFD
jgi:hypothetical protein